MKISQPVENGKWRRMLFALVNLNGLNSVTNMPSNSRLYKKFLAAALAANLAVIFYFWWRGSHAFITGDLGKQLIAYGRISGLLLVFLVLVQLILIGRTGWVEKVFGLDKLSRLHHWIGFFLAALLVGHPLLLTLGYSQFTDSGILEQFVGFQGWQDVLAATAAFGLFLILILASLIVLTKKMKYETWYFIHLIAYAAILLAFGHQLAVGRDLQDKSFATYWYALYVFVLLNLLYFRFYLPLRNYLRHGFQVKKIVHETADVISVYLTAHDLPRFRFKAGQFLIVRFLAKGLWWQAHPFSLSCAPGSGLRLTIKRSGDFTAALWGLKPGTKMLVDGPHGAFTADCAARGKFLFIAGGIGITPILSLIASLTPAGKDCALIYTSRNAAGTVLKNEVDALAANHCRVHYIMSADAGWTGVKGFLNKEILLHLVPDLLQRDVYVCGPPPMMKKVLADLSSVGVPATRIHFEKFSL